MDLTALVVVEVVLALARNVSVGFSAVCAAGWLLRSCRPRASHRSAESGKADGHDVGWPSTIEHCCGSLQSLQS